MTAVATLGVGIIGASRVAPEHARAVAADARTHLVAIADPDTARAEKVAEQYGCEVVADYRDILKRPDVAVVMLGLPSASTPRSASRRWRPASTSSSRSRSPTPSKRPTG